MKKAQRADAESTIRGRYLKVKDSLSERARRLFVASEAMSLGHGGIAAATRATGMAASVIAAGIIGQAEPGSPYDVISPDIAVARFKGLYYHTTLVRSERQR